MLLALRNLIYKQALCKPASRSGHRYIITSKTLYKSKMMERAMSIIIAAHFDKLLRLYSARNSEMMKEMF